MILEVVIGVVGYGMPTTMR